MSTRGTGNDVAISGGASCTTFGEGDYDISSWRSAGISGGAVVGALREPAANEAGWKDTVQMHPGEVTRIIATFDKPGEYVWHCHILRHEKHDMMRPLMVLVPRAAAAPVARNLIRPKSRGRERPEHSIRKCGLRRLGHFPMLEPDQKRICAAVP